MATKKTKATKGPKVYYFYIHAYRDGKCLTGYVTAPNETEAKKRFRAWLRRLSSVVANGERDLEEKGDKVRLGEPRVFLSGWGEKDTVIVAEELDGQGG